MHGLCMPTKTISIELDAYEKLAAAKTGARGLQIPCVIYELSNTLCNL
jgi:predicted CopG family antitoxin